METTPSIPQRHLRFWSSVTRPPHFNTRAINQPFSITIVWGLRLSRVRGWQRWKTFSQHPRGCTGCVGNICENCITLNIRGEKNVRNHHIITDIHTTIVKESRRSEDRNKCPQASQSGRTSKSASSKLWGACWVVIFRIFLFIYLFFIWNTWYYTSD